MERPEKNNKTKAHIALGTGLGTIVFVSLRALAPRHIADLIGYMCLAAIVVLGMVAFAVSKIRQHSQKTKSR